MKKSMMEDIRSYVMGSLFNIIVFAVTMVLVVVVSVNAFNYGEKILSGDDGHMEENPEIIEFIIPENADTSKVANILKEKNFIDNEFIFRLQTKLNGTDRLIRSGTYKLPLGISANDLMEELQKVPDYASNEEKVTIPEGLTIKEMAAYIEKEYDFFTEAEFLVAAKDIDTYDFRFIQDIPEREYLLEGYLFPDTYFLPEDPTPQHLIARMLTRFEDIYGEFSSQADDLGLTTDEVLTIASIIEKEIKLSSEREKASGVIFERLAQNMPLQMCSTVLYVLDTSREKLTLKDLEVESSYNTYIHSGLPPGPITAPGKASIEAALMPDRTFGYLYFVLQDQETGKHYFTDDYDDFLFAKNLFGDEF